MKNSIFAIPKIGMAFFLHTLQMRNKILVLMLCLASISSYSQGIDSTIKKSLFIIPVGYYQKETNVALGVVGGYYFGSSNLKKISSISYNAIYTFNNQFMFGVNPKIYSKDKNSYIASDISFRYYPDFYYGIGNKESKIKEVYTSQLVQINLQPQHYIGENWLIGANISARGEKLSYPNETSINLPQIYNQYGNAGWNPYFMLGVGGLITYNTRDNFFYPNKGIFSKIAFLYYSKLLGSSYNLGAFNFDFRQYLPTWKGQLFTYQFYADCVVGNEIPFQLLPTLGGRDKLRGFREGIFRDKLLLIAQTEYRIPLYKKIKGTIFCSAGNVTNTDNFEFNKLKVSYGGGLRYQVNDARVHLRLDYALTNYNDSGFYLTVTEAF